MNAEKKILETFSITYLLFQGIKQFTYSFQQLYVSPKLLKAVLPLHSCQQLHIRPKLFKTKLSL